MKPWQSSDIMQLCRNPTLPVMEERLRQPELMEQFALFKVKDDPYDIKNTSNPNRSWTVFTQKPVNSALLNRLGFKDAWLRREFRRKGI